MTFEPLSSNTQKSFKLLPLPEFLDEAQLWTGNQRNFQLFVGSNICTGYRWLKIGILFLKLIKRV